MTRLSLILIGAILVGCTSPQPPRAMPPALGLSPQATYAAYLDQRPKQGKLHHQVESAFGPRNDAIEGIFVFREPAQFLVRAQSAFGPALFDVKHVPDAPLSVTVHLDALKDERFARYLARDIDRVYFAECPNDASTKVEQQGNDVIASCALSPRGERIANDKGPDDKLVTQLALSGVALQKTFRRGNKVTAVITYDDYRLVQGAWLAHRIALVGHDAPYKLTIVLAEADLSFDAGRVFSPSAPAVP